MVPPLVEGHSRLRLLQRPQHLRILMIDALYLLLSRRKIQGAW